MRGGSDGSSLVQFGIDSQGEFAGKVLARIDTILGAGFEEYAQRDFALTAQASAHPSAFLGRLGA